MMYFLGYILALALSILLVWLMEDEVTVRNLIAVSFIGLGSWITAIAATLIIAVGTVVTLSEKYKHLLDKKLF